MLVENLIMIVTININLLFWKKLLPPKKKFLLLLRICCPQPKLLSLSKKISNSVIHVKSMQKNSFKEVSFRRDDALPNYDVNVDVNSLVAVIEVNNDLNY